MQAARAPQESSDGCKAASHSSDGTGQDIQTEESALYRSDEFRMYCFKVLPCSKRYCHDWTTCPFAHPGEKAKRRDPRVYTYTGVACPEMKKSLQCPRGDTCPYAHNVFEYWLHPSRYRTQLCNDGVQCRRKICFFAHTLEELRVSSVKVLPADGKGAPPPDTGFELDPFRPEGGRKGGKNSSSNSGGPGSSSPVSPLSPDLFEHSKNNQANGAGRKQQNNKGSNQQQHAQQDAAAMRAAWQQQQQAAKAGASTAGASVAQHMAALAAAQQVAQNAQDLAPFLTDIQQLQQLAAVQAHAQVQAQLAAAQVAMQAQQSQQQQGVEQLAHSLATLQLANAMPNQSISDVVNAVVQQLVACGAIGSQGQGAGASMQPPANAFAAYSNLPPALMNANSASLFGPSSATAGQLSRSASAPVPDAGMAYMAGLHHGPPPAGAHAALANRAAAAHAALGGMPMHGPQALPPMPHHPHHHQGVPHHMAAGMDLSSYRSGSVASHCGSMTPPISDASAFAEYHSRSSMESARSEGADSGGGGMDRLLNFQPGHISPVGTPPGTIGSSRLLAGATSRPEAPCSGPPSGDFVPELFSGDRDIFKSHMPQSAAAGINSPFHL